jgi:hypothetical protein
VGKLRSSALDFVEQYLRQLSPLHSATVWQTKYVRPDSERKFFQRPDPRMVAILANCPLLSLLSSRLSARRFWGLLLGPTKDPSLHEKDLEADGDLRYAQTVISNTPNPFSVSPF